MIIFNDDDDESAYPIWIVWRQHIPRGEPLEGLRWWQRYADQALSIQALQACLFT
jgi:hypothetical protein